MGRLSARNQMLIAGAVIVVLAIAFVFLGILPLFEQASDIDTQIAAERTNLSTAQALLARRQSAKAQSASNEVELMRIANTIPDTPQLPSVIIELQRVANEAGLEFATLNVSDLTAGPAAEDGTSPYSVLQLTAVLNGAWSDMIEYLHRIDDLQRGVRVASVDFSRNEGEEGEDPYIQANVTLEVYVMPTSVVPVGAAPAETPSQ